MSRGSSRYTRSVGKALPSFTHCLTCTLQVIHCTGVVVMNVKTVALGTLLLAIAATVDAVDAVDANDVLEDMDLLAAVEAEDCFSEDCDAAGLALAQLRATYLKTQMEAAPKFQYYGGPEEFDFDAAIQEDSEVGIAFVQTSAKLVTGKESSAFTVSADGTVGGVHGRPSLSERPSFTVAADGRTHVEM
mmetsp:Transcript_35825/g.80154  ORF Transcript_35825/g.80154 Transcript_35825/m.80154 type:complete len:189 (+) Transcript_35825:8-574(+)